MSDLDCDVLVVGAGPAGSLTAKYAAQKGARVLMIEKRQEIGSPVRCGEGIAREWIHDVGIKLDRKWIAHEVEGAKIISPNGTEMKINERIAGNEVGTVIERDLFDKALAKDAAKAGADIMLKTSALEVLKERDKIIGARAIHMGEEFKINAKITVGADGFESQIGRWADIDTSLKPIDITTCLQYRLTNIQPDPDYCEFFLGNCYAPGGYIWVFPKSEDTANVGVGVQLAKIKMRGEVKKYIDNFIQKHERFSKGKILDIVAGAVSISAPIDRTVGDGILLVGDAARMVDPITGGGIANACRAGKVAGEVIAEAIETKDYSKEFLEKYEKGWRELMEEGLYRNWMAKEKLVTLTDETFDKIIGTLAEVGVEKLSVYNILKVVQDRHPELVKEFEDFL